MINLASTSDKLRLTTSGSANVEVHASWVDLLGTTVTPGRTNTADITSATTTDIVASPAASTVRNVKLLSIINSHASVTADVEVIHTDGTTAQRLNKSTLAPGEGLTFSEGYGWQRLNSAGLGQVEQAQPLILLVLEPQVIVLLLVQDKM